MSDVTTSKNRQNKEAIIAELSTKVEKAQAMVFANYQGLTHQQLETLKRSLKKADAEFVAIKNTLLMRALKGKVDTEANKDHFTKPTGAMFIYGDVVEPLKLLSKSIKDLKLPELKFGYIDGNTVSGEGVLKIATLPPLPVLRAMLLGQMKSPIQGLHRALNWNMQSLVMTLNAIKDKKTA